MNIVDYLMLVMMVFYICLMIVFGIVIIRGWRKIVEWGLERVRRVYKIIFESYRSISLIRDKGFYWIFFLWNRGIVKRDMIGFLISD